MPFKKGQSGNPSGRRKKTSAEYDVEEACRLLTPEMLDIITEVARNGEKGSVRANAANAIIQRGYGMPRQKQELTGADNMPLIPKLVIQVKDKPE